MVRPAARLHSALRAGTALVGVAAASVQPSAATPALPPDLQPAAQALMTGHADQVTTLLQTALTRNPNQGAAHLLLCRVQLSTLHAAEAAAECRLALRNGLDGDSEAQDIAGRALGMQASHAGPFSAMKLAGEVHTAFEAAHRLDPHSAAAANDLGEYYIHAPSLVGGGTDKAIALANALQATLPEIADRLHALLAEKAGDLPGAERAFLAATEVAQQPGTFVDLATYYNRHGDSARAVAAARRAVQLDHSVDADAVEAAGALNDAHQPTEAAAALRAYLDHGHQSDQAPVFRVHLMLGHILAVQGDRAGARSEYTTALALASNYGPARKALDSL